MGRPVSMSKHMSMLFIFKHRSHRRNRYERLWVFLKANRYSGMGKNYGK